MMGDPNPNHQLTKTGAREVVGLASSLFKLQNNPKTSHFVNLFTWFFVTLDEMKRTKRMSFQICSNIGIAYYLCLNSIHHQNANAEIRRAWP